jgi:multiple sugar transport system substrate-binding protein
MRTTTAILFAAFLLGVGALTASIRLASSRRDGDRREITFACWGAVKEVGELQKLVVDPINERNRHFRIRVLPIPSDYHIKLTTMTAGGAAPDLFYLPQEYVRAFAAQGALLDLTDRVARDEDPVTDLSTYYPSVLAPFRHADRLYGLPWIAQPVILYCNRTLFERAGEPLPDSTWDWARFVRASRNLTRDTDGDGRVDQWGFIVSNGWPPMHMWIWQNGGRLIDPVSRTARLDDPRVLDALDACAGLIHRESVAPPLSIVSERGFSDLFRAGKIAMFMGGAADDLDRLDGLDVIAAEVPAGPAGIRATFAYTAGLHISSTVTDADLVYVAWKQLLNGIQRWKIPAPRRDLAARLEEFEPRKSQGAQVIRASMEYMRTPQILDHHVEWDTAFSEEVLEELLREGTPARELVGRAHLEAWR